MRRCQELLKQWPVGKGGDHQSNGTLGLETRKQVAAADDLPSRRGGDEADAYRQAQIAKAEKAVPYSKFIEPFVMTIVREVAATGRAI